LGRYFERFNACSKKLQSIQIDLGMVIEIYQSLITYISDIQTDEMFVDYKVRAVEKCGISHFKNTTQRKKKQKLYFDDGHNEEQILDESEKFKVNTYFLIIDQIKTELEKRKIAYDDITSKYNFVFHLIELTPTEVKESAQFLKMFIKMTWHHHFLLNVFIFNLI